MFVQHRISMENYVQIEQNYIKGIFVYDQSFHTSVYIFLIN